MEIIYNIGAAVADSNVENYVWGIIGASLGIFAVVFVIGVLLYVLGGIGLMRIAERENEEYPWLSWIPYASSYLQCKVATGNVTLAWCYTIIPVVANMIFGVYALNIFSVIANQMYYGNSINPNELSHSLFDNLSGLINFAIWVFNIVLDYKIYKKYSKYAVGMLIGTILTGGILSPVFLFVIRNNKKIPDISVMNSPDNSDKTNI